MDAFTVVDELEQLQARLRLPQRMDEAHRQTDDVRATLHRLTTELEAALQTVARTRPVSGARPLPPSESPPRQHEPTGTG